MNSEDSPNLIDELNATIGWLKRTGALVDAGRVQRAVAALEASAVSSPSEEREHMQSLAKWVGVPESTSSLEIACEVSSALENLSAVSSPPTITDDGDTKLAAMIQEWIDGEPFEISAARAGEPVEWVDPNQQPGFLQGHAAAVRHVSAILAAALLPGGETNGK